MLTVLFFENFRYHVRLEWYLRGRKKERESLSISYYYTSCQESFKPLNSSARFASKSYTVCAIVFQDYFYKLHGFPFTFDSKLLSSIFLFRKNNAEISLLKTCQNISRAFPQDVVQSSSSRRLLRASSTFSSRRHLPSRFLLEFSSVLSSGFSSRFSSGFSPRPSHGSRDLNSRTGVADAKKLHRELTGREETIADPQTRNTMPPW